jgi:hypothetical protein
LGLCVTLKEVADLIESIDAKPLLWGNYLNRRKMRGYYFQTQCGNHWCKVSISHADFHSERITIADLDEITPEMIDKISAPTPNKVLIPTHSIVNALRSTAAEETSLNKYLNNSAVEGMWAEFHYANSWYMVSVSHIDLPSNPKPGELDRIADEFLWQQDKKAVKKRRYGW